VRVLELACDESGSEGEHLVGGNTDVFAHASVRLTTESATECILELRDRIRSPAEEYKANHLLRSKHRSALEWLLGVSGPIRGNARVHLTDKAFFVVGRVVELLVGDRAAAVALYRAGRPAFGDGPWQAFLESSNDLLRRYRGTGGAPVDGFFRAVEALPPHEILAGLRRARPRAEAVRSQLLAYNPRAVPVLDTLIPALARAVVHWGRDGTAVSIVHDEHSTLTVHRVARLTELVGGACRLTGVRLVDSRCDPRVQVADFLAGVARKIASDELNGRGDPELTGLLRPYVDPRSVWADQPSWARLSRAA
jgi:hypothetical protein